MHSHLLILAILSVRALAGFILTAHDHTDSHCTKKAIGKQIDLSGPQCVVYQPEQPDAFIQIKSHAESENHPHYLVIFSDTNCQDVIGILGPDDINVNNSTCYNMTYIADIAPGPWGSAMRNETLELDFSF